MSGTARNSFSHADAVAIYGELQSSVPDTTLATRETPPPLSGFPFSDTTNQTSEVRKSNRPGLVRG